MTSPNQEALGADIIRRVGELNSLLLEAAESDMLITMRILSRASLGREDALHIECGAYTAVKVRTP